MEPFDFVHQANADYIDQLHSQYLKDPRSVPENWRAFFAGFEVGLARSSQEGPKPALPTGPLNMGVFDLVHSYRELGHFISNLDPLGLIDRGHHPLLELSNFGMTETDLSREVGVGGFLGQTDGTLADLINKLRSTYCGALGVEFININNKDQRDWLMQRMEPNLNQPQFTPEQTRSLMFQLIAAEEFEHYLARVYVGTKRFGLEGGESFIPLVNTIVDEGAIVGGEQFIMAMAHRGRLNALAHIINKPYEVILSEFEGTSLPSPDDQGDGDVKYHLGYATKRRIGDKREIKVSLLPNPSHLELINPIMQGIIRCKQQYFGDIGRKHVVPIVIHGDAAFTGQGVVAETLNLSELAGFSTGGSIHIIINNQIGFTTPPRQGRFTPYATDVAKAINSPIFHVNGDDPEAVVWAAKLAVGFRQEFKSDVFIDMWCYRRNGHNEADEPTFTHPVMYKRIADHKTTRQLYAERLLREGRMTQTELDEMQRVVTERLASAREQAKVVKPRSRAPGFSGVWKGLGRAGHDWTAKTNVTKETLNQIISVYENIPSSFTVHPKVQKTVVEKRLESVRSGTGIDWGTAEMLAFGSLLLEKFQIRLTGQDVERGTFSHRHAVLYDYNSGEQYFPLAQLAPDKPAFTVINSMLSEFAVLGFEWGYASADPRNLVLWEAQFGDFVNGAQPIIDQILAAAESKWRYMNGMVLLLPHGYEGAGPEHSNAYLERFLSLCAEDNMQVCMLSTPAQFFHALRRQVHRKFRKPLVLMQPKALLRDPNRASTIEEFTDVSFQNVIDDAGITEPDRVRRVIVCSGKVYYALRDARDASRDKGSQIAIVRVEQLYPFPEHDLSAILSRYGRKTEVFWVQEEPKNRGAWSFMEPRLRTMLPDTLISYAGRDAAASPAVGSIKEHNKEEKEFVTTALKLSVPSAAPVTR